MALRVATANPAALFRRTALASRSGDVTPFGSTHPSLQPAHPDALRSPTFAVAALPPHAAPAPAAHARLFSGSPQRPAPPKASAGKAPAKPKPDPVVSAQRLQLRALLKDTSFQPPKAPLSPYILFFKERYNGARVLKGDKVDAARTVKALGKMWNELGGGEKQKYVDRATTLRTEYEKQLATFERNKTPGDYVKEKALNSLLRKFRPNARQFRVSLPPGAPKRPLSGYMRFNAYVSGLPAMQQAILLGGKPLADLSIAERGRSLGKAWREAPAAERERFDRQAREEQEKYREQMGRLEGRMEKAKKEVKEGLKGLVKERKVKLGLVRRKKVKVAKKKTGVRRRAATTRRAVAKAKPKAKAKVAAKAKPKAKSSTKKKLAPTTHRVKKTVGKAVAAKTKPVVAAKKPAARARA